MEIQNADKLKNTNNIYKLLVGILIGIVATLTYTHFQTSTLSANLKQSISLQESKVITMSEITDSNVADQTVSKVVADCQRSEREQYDNLLSSLSDTYSLAQLNDLSILHKLCGKYYASLKTINVMRLQKEIEVLDDLVKVTESNTITVDGWYELLAKEQQQADLFRKLADIQGLIITALTKGESAKGEVVKELLLEASALQEFQQVVNIEIDNLRNSLIEK